MMRRALRALYHGILNIPGILTPASVARRIDIEKRTVSAFVNGFIVEHISPDDLLLDAGAGFGQYRSALSKARYEATDFEDMFDQWAKSELDFVCDLADIPKPDAVYDVIVNIQVLEHVDRPERVIAELARILKPGGRLFLTTDQTFMMHGVPYCYFFFTRYGLERLFTNAGLEIKFIRARGGVFYVLATFMHFMPQMIFFQFCYGGFKDGIRKQQELKRPVLAAALLPLYVIAQITIGTYIP